MVEQLGKSYYVAGVLADHLEFAAQRQRGAYWCAPACGQMVMNFHHISLSQEEIVHRVHGAQRDWPMLLSDVAGAVRGLYWNVYNCLSIMGAQHLTFSSTSIFGDTIFGDVAFGNVISGDLIVQSLAKDRPLIVGLNIPQQDIGHACVLTAAYYYLDIDDTPVFEKVILRDPSPFNQSRREIPAEGFVASIESMIEVWPLW